MTETAVTSCSGHIFAGGERDGTPELGHVARGDTPRDRVGVCDGCEQRNRSGAAAEANLRGDGEWEGRREWIAFVWWRGWEDATTGSVFSSSIPLLSSPIPYFMLY